MRFSGDEHVAARHEAFQPVLLEDAEDPFRGMENRVAGELRAIHADERRRAQAALDDIVADDDAGGFVLRTGRTEIRPAPVEPPMFSGRWLASMKWHFSTVMSDGPALHLQSGAGRKAGLPGEPAAGDERAVAAHESIPWPPQPVIVQSRIVSPSRPESLMPS